VTFINNQGFINNKLSPHYHQHQKYFFTMQFDPLYIITCSGKSGLKREVCFHMLYFFIVCFCM